MTSITRYLYYSQVDSTNNEAKRLLRLKQRPLIFNETEDAVIIAHCQTKGRGTHGRQWHSEKNGGLYYTYVFPVSNNQETDVLVRSAGNGVINAILEVSGLSAEMHWPNDIIIKNQKVAGILIERVKNKHTNNSHYLIVGIGLNLNQTSFHATIDNVAISLKQLRRKEICRYQTIVTLTKELQRAYKRN